MPLETILGFLIAVIVGLTGMGGGSFTAPALILLAGLPTGEAVGTSLIFAAVVRILAAPFYVVKRHIHLEYLGLLLLGAIPGILLGTWLLHRMYVDSWKPAVLVIVGILLAISSAITFLPKLRNPQFARKRIRWLALLAFPIGLETGLSSAGAGALGTVLLLNFSEMEVAQIVGTDLLFGIILAFFGGAFHLMWGSIDAAVVVRLLAGGIPGVLVGCALAGKIPSQTLRPTIALIAIVLGIQLVYTGGRDLLRQHHHSVQNLGGRIATLRLRR